MASLGFRNYCRDGGGRISRRVEGRMSAGVGAGVRAQVSMEFLMVVTLTFLLIIPLVILFFKESQSATEQVNLAQVSQIARRMIGSAEAVHALGEPTSVVIKVYIPAGVNSVLISGREVSFVVDSNGRLVTVSESSSVNMSGSFSTIQGIHNIRVTAANNSAVISEFSS